MFPSFLCLCVSLSHTLVTLLISFAWWVFRIYLIHNCYNCTTNKKRTKCSRMISHPVTSCLSLHGQYSPPILPSHMIICTAHYIIMSFFCIQKQKNNLQFYFFCCVIPKWEAKPLQKKSLSSSFCCSSSPTHGHHHHHSQLLNWKLADLAFQEILHLQDVELALQDVGTCTTQCGACIARCGNLHYKMWSSHY
jgi:hypothetical protein